jgi:hypothetical protein
MLPPRRLRYDPPEDLPADGARKLSRLHHALAQLRPGFSASIDTLADETGDTALCLDRLLC